MSLRARSGGTSEHTSLTKPVPWRARRAHEPVLSPSRLSSALHASSAYFRLLYVVLRD